MKEQTTSTAESEPRRLSRAGETPARGATGVEASEPGTSDATADEYVEGDPSPSPSQQTGERTPVTHVPDAPVFGEPVTGERVKWHVLHVRSRHEKVVSEDLTAMGIHHYLPLVRRTRNDRGRRVVVELPLFPCYLFLKGTMEDAYRADRTKRVARIIPVADQRRLERELANLKLALDVRGDLDPYPFLKAGLRVVVRSGPLRGLRGMIESRTKQNRLVVQVEMLAKAASLEIDGEVLEVLD